MFLSVLLLPSVAGAVEMDTVRGGSVRLCLTTVVMFRSLKLREPVAVQSSSCVLREFLGSHSWFTRVQRFYGVQLKLFFFYKAKLRQWW